MPRTKSLHLHLPFLNFDKSRNLKFLYALITARNLSNKLIFFFFPLFLFDLGKSLNLGLFSSLDAFQRGVLMIACVYFSIRLINFIVAIPVGQIIQKIGSERGLLVGSLLYTIVVVLLHFSTKISWFIIPAAIVDGFQIAFFYGSYYTVFSKNSSKSKVGKDLGFLYSLLSFVAMISPAIGGLVIAILGYPALFAIGLVISLVGSYFALQMENEKVKDEVSWREFFVWISEKRYKRLALSFFGKYINDATLTVWPLYVMLILGSVTKVGFLYTISLFSAVVLSFFIGAFLDKSKKARKPFLLSGGLLSVLWFVRTQIVSIWTIVAVDMMDKLTSNFHSLFFDRMWMLRGKGSQALSYFVYREMILSAGAVLFWWIFASFFIAFPLGWQGLFVFAALGVMLSLLVKERDGN